VMHSARRRLDLAGEWNLAFDANGAGLSSGWAAGNWPQDACESVKVPALWTVTHPDKVGIGFYHKTVEIPVEWHGRVVRLCIGGASYRLDAWLNGRYVGSHEGAYTPFSFDVTGAACFGASNELVLRVASLCKTQAVDGLVLQHCPASKQSWYYIEAGLWGDVYLEALPTSWCEAIAVEPDVQRERVVADIEIHHAQAQPGLAELHLLITAPDGQTAVEQVHSVTLLPGATHHTFRLPLARPVLWSCENPALYRLQATLTIAGEPPDSAETRFGMRDFTVQDGQFLLNGQPIYLRGVLLQPNYPVTLICPPEPDMMRREIQLSKEAGFNLIRTHIRPSPPGYLDITDELGMLVYAETPLAWIRDNPRLLEHGKREIEAMIRRDRNHPSVVFWGIFNENRQASAVASDELIRFTRALDSTRVVVDNSGGSMAIDQDFGWVDRATVIANRRLERQKIVDVHIYVGAPIANGVYEWLRTLGTDDPPVDITAYGFGSAAIMAEFNRELRSYRGKVFVSELGCGGMSDLDDTVQRFGGRDLVDAQELRTFRDGLQQGFAKRNLERVFGSLQNLIAASQEAQARGNVRQVEALLTNPRVSGYVVTQLNDVAWEFHAGLLDVWRNPKKAYWAMQRVNRTHCLILKAAHAVAAAGEHIAVTVTLVNTAPLEKSATLSVTVYDTQQIPVVSENITAPPGVGVAELGAIAFDTGSAAGEFRVVARLLADAGAILAETVETILVLPPIDVGPACRQVTWPGGLPNVGSPVQGGVADGGHRRLLGLARPASLRTEDWQSLLVEVEAGSVAIIGPLTPHDDIALSALARHDVAVNLYMGIGNWMGCYHWIPASPLFASLPAPGLAGEPYADVLPRYVLSEQGGDILAGSLRNTQSRLEPPAILWYSDIEAVPFGRGRLIFCQYRVFDQETPNPLAARLLCNLIGVAQGYLA